MEALNAQPALQGGDSCWRAMQSATKALRTHRSAKQALSSFGVEPPPQPVWQSARACAAWIWRVHTRHRKSQGCALKLGLGGPVISPVSHCWLWGMSLGDLSRSSGIRMSRPVEALLREVNAPAFCHGMLEWRPYGLVQKSLSQPRRRGPRRPRRPAGPRTPDQLHHQKASSCEVTMLGSPQQLQHQRSLGPSSGCGARREMAPAGHGMPWQERRAGAVVLEVKMQRGSSTGGGRLRSAAQGSAPSWLPPSAPSVEPPPPRR